nr:type III-B CRISPR module RAMP protein Cmr6 [uncultured Dethiosulfovibrio sp.]
MKAMREAIAGLDRSKISHGGLFLQRYLPEQKNSDQGDPAVWDAYFDQASTRKKIEDRNKGYLDNAAFYKLAFSRWKRSWAGKDGMVSIKKFKVKDRLVCGLGGASPTETGLTLHHTYGTPVIPGSSIKGVAAHYCHKIWGEADETFKEGGEAHSVMFGTTEDQGHIIFHDALVVPQGWNVWRDIMTPHHKDYYGDKGGSAPTDFDSPVPVSFLSVSGSFQVVIECDDPSEEGQGWLKLATELVKEALDKWGVGGKTSSGYGQLNWEGELLPPEPPKEDPYAEGKKVTVLRVPSTNRRKADRLEFSLLEDGEEVPLEGKLAVCLAAKEFEATMKETVKMGQDITVKIAKNDLKAKPPRLFVIPE